mmetsp:Transcript_49927/g.108749  ORF Transcript_49927/g.108749 Transcript_49927/m.108749 type:complete len:236 (+) Transcript_49927:227-934(+)
MQSPFLERQRAGTSLHVHWREREEREVALPERPGPGALRPLLRRVGLLGARPGPRLRLGRRHGSGGVAAGHRVGHHARHRLHGGSHQSPRLIGSISVETRQIGSDGLPRCRLGQVAALVGHFAKVCAGHRRCLRCRVVGSRGEIMPAKPHRCRRLGALRRCLFHRTEGTYRQVARDGGWSEGANQHSSALPGLLGAPSVHILPLSQLPKPLGWRGGQFHGAQLALLAVSAARCWG